MSAFGQPKRDDVVDDDERPSSSSSSSSLPLIDPLIDPRYGERGGIDYNPRPLPELIGSDKPHPNVASFHPMNDFLSLEDNDRIIRNIPSAIVIRLIAGDPIRYTDSTSLGFVDDYVITIDKSKSEGIEDLEFLVNHCSPMSRIYGFLCYNLPLVIKIQFSEPKSIQGLSSNSSVIRIGPNMFNQYAHYTVSGYWCIEGDVRYYVLFDKKGNPSIYTKHADDPETTLRLTQRTGLTNPQFEKLFLRKI